MPDQFPTLAEAEEFLQAQGFRPTGVADWINEAGDDAGVYAIEQAWRVEINRQFQQLGGKT